MIRRSEEETKTAGGIVLPGLLLPRNRTVAKSLLSVRRVLTTAKCARPLRSATRWCSARTPRSNTAKVDGDLLVMSENEILAVIEA